MYIYRVGVVGAGTMGAQIAQVISYAGLPVVLIDVTMDKAQQGMETVRRIYHARVERGKMTPEQAEEKMLLVSTGCDFTALQDVDLVIEAVSENLALKRQILHELDANCGAGAILASNTSALSISALSAATRRPGKLLGLHFFNPAYAMPLVEIIPGLATDPETVNDVVNFAESIRKLPIVVKECAGFLVNRLLMSYLNEAVLCVQEGAASCKDIEQDMIAFGMPVGPFTLLDTVGLDISYDVAKILYEHYGPRMAPAALLAELVKDERFGVKNGHGFYEYEGPDTGMLDRVIEKVRQETGQRNTPWKPTRLLLAMVNEAVLALQEGVASARDIDLAMVAGIGFPKEKEGPLHYADALGIDTVLADLDAYARTLGARFWPAPMLRRMVSAGFTGRAAGRGFFTY
ncbi:MAG TPA: 3-hydroxyacyl-CoA dehydrogenase NAD-binding domain-containing protein [Nitrospiraceae bacterium]|nr:3-hydroxyacyl-CoA dehydrogenase NAD-binding domain-containing protein [Nitrospiraceae bacterium]